MNLFMAGLFVGGLVIAFTQVINRKRGKRCSTCGREGKGKTVFLLDEEIKIIQSKLAK